ncbi:GNAT family N-acetyltransferase [Cochleicola gelatinilyticus]|uniref:GNAT family acetyltransferase n=1 Tax=Cochleicola gelatinilyticus TaxID=1763537 RepID=A0A167J3X2_9FLAO|nr:GNAT family N-acetyltransferase [Cochleicola gelatinilyticus]OAB80305.1 GNAT family acetyltransferase [Cochleicola gelatinilyticus]
MIRKAKLSEIEEIINLTKACAAHMISQNIFQWNEHYPNKEAFLKDLDRQELYVLFSENSIVGCVVISSEKDAEYNDISWRTDDSIQYYIHRLAVHPKHQGFGNARKLMDFAEAYGKTNNAISIRLDTFSKNVRNQRFYERRGYLKLGTIYFPKQSKHPFFCYELIL